MSSNPLNRPTLSTVLCTYNRAELLRRTLDSLCRQSLDKTFFEIVLIDDGSNDDTRQVVRAYESLLPLRYSFQRNAGLGSAKNHGVFLSRGDILLFLDDDDIADPHLLEQHLNAHRRFPDDRYGVLGYTELESSIADDPLMNFVTRVGCHLFSYPNIKDGDILDFTYFWGGRSSCKRALLIKHGIFNPVFRFGCEDIELGFRLSRHGFKVVYEPSAVSYMVRKVEYDEFCRRLYRQGRSNHVFSRLHSDVVVQQWTGVIGATRAWAKIEPTYAAVIRSARELDRIARLRAECGLPMNEMDMNLLHQGYSTAFQASKIKGIVEKAREIGGVVSGRSDAMFSSAPSRLGPTVYRSLRKMAAIIGVREAGTRGKTQENARYPELSLGAIREMGGESAADSQGHSPRSRSSRGVNRVHQDPSAWELTTFTQIIESPPKIHGGGIITWALDKDVLNFILRNVSTGLRTLETGCGVSSIVFALRGTNHCAITPSTDEAERIKQYCSEKRIPTEKISFRIGKSQDVLPSLEGDNYDVILIDGCHAFPIPFLDWYYSSERLRVDGLLIIDDTQLWPCRVLCQFLMREEEWRVETTFSRSMVFRKLKDVPAKEWTDQPFVVDQSS